MIAKKKKPSEEEKKVIVEEVLATEEEVSTTSEGVPATEGQEPSAETEETLSERPLGEEIPLDKTNKKLFRAGLIVVLIIFGLTGWIFYLTNRYSQKTIQEEITFKETETATPTPAPELVQLKREEITLEILNGSGVAGAAGDAAEIFEALGYVDVETGNGDDTVGNELYVNPEFKDAINVLLEDVESELDISSIAGELKDSDYVARIILGE